MALNGHTPMLEEFTSVACGCVEELQDSAASGPKRFHGRRIAGIEAPAADAFLRLTVGGLIGGRSRLWTPVQ